MNPAAHLSLALVSGLVLWLPTLSATLRGDADLFAAAIRYLVGFVFAWVAIGLLARLIHSYASAAEQDVPLRVTPVDDVDQHTANAA